MKKLLFMQLAVIYILQLLLVYNLAPGIKFIDITPLPAGKYFLIPFWILSVALLVLNIVTAFLGIRQDGQTTKKAVSLGAVMGFKLGLIPFFIGHIFWFMVALGATANPFLMVLWFVIPFLFLLYAYLVVLSTSSYSIVQIYKMYKAAILTKKCCIFHIIMQLLFCADVVDSVYLL